jgi:hypothetical protein
MSGKSQKLRSCGQHTPEERMGLHLCYRLTLPGSTSSDDVRVKLSALKEFADTVGFDDVLGPTEYSLTDLVELDNRDIIGIVTSTMCGDPPDFYGVPSGESCAFAFVAVPGEECEPATFGFVAPGSRRDPLGPEDDLHPGEWFWSACCKTQYASVISDDHLIKCHAGLVRVLEHASTLGITVEVDDETGYWEHRSPDKLVAVVRNMNRLIARVAGEMERRFAGKHDLQAPIFDHPDFEHLEMEELELFDQADGADPRAP